MEMLADEVKWQLLARGFPSGVSRKSSREQLKATPITVAKRSPQSAGWNSTQARV